MINPKVIEAVAWGFIIGRGENATVSRVDVVGDESVITVRNGRGNEYQTRKIKGGNEQIVCGALRVVFDSIEWSYY